MLVVHAPALPDPLPNLGAPALRACQRFSTNNGMLTPSLKMCRRAIVAAHSSQLEQLAEGQGRFARLIQAVTSGECVEGQNDSLAAMGVDSLQWAVLASKLSLPVHSIAAAHTVADLSRLFSKVHSSRHTDSHGTELGSDGGQKFVDEGGQRFVDEARDDFKKWSRSLSTLSRQQMGTTDEGLEQKKWMTVLVTGATGHIGHHFCLLLEQKGMHVIKVSRALGINISCPLFGLPQSEYLQMQADADAVVHCAAIVNWSASYSAVRGSNVDGTAHVIQFCCTADGPPKPLLMLSSGAGFPEQEACIDWLAECCSPYMASKLVAECLAQRYCPSVVTVRPGLVVWDSQTGALCGML